jgi:hypothetical protein
LRFLVHLVERSIRAVRLSIEAKEKDHVAVRRRIHIWHALFYIPRYIRARWDFRDSMLAILVSRVDELARRLDAIAEKK